MLGFTKTSNAGPKNSGNVKNNIDQQSTCYKSISLDSKPDFQYVLSASKGIHRKEIIKRSAILIKAALAEYNKKRGMVISYNQDIDKFEISLITDILHPIK